MLLSMNRCTRWARLPSSMSIVFAFAIAPALSEAQTDAAPTQKPPAVAAPEASSANSDATGQAAHAAVRFTREELRVLLAPIALFPDALLAQILPASAYPVEIVQAQRWLDANKALVLKNDFSGIDKQDWDPAVKAVVRFPDAIRKMSDQLERTADVGDAFVNQPQDVADVIQELRSEAEKSGALKSTPQQTVKRVGSGSPQGERSTIVIEPTNPSTIYVPTYDPNAVYGATSVVAPLLTFGTGIALGALATGAYWKRGTGAVYPPVWAGYPGYRPGMPPPNGGNGPWRPSGDYRPGQGGRLEGRPGGAGGIGKPGGVGGPGGIGKPGGIGGVGKPGGVAGPSKPGGAGGIGKPGRPGGAGRPGGGSRPGAGNRPASGARPGGAARPGAARPGRGARPATRPVGRPSGGYGPRPGAYGPRSGGFSGGGRPGGYGGGRHAGFHGGHRGGGAHGGGHRRAAGGRGGGRRSDLRLKHDVALLGRIEYGLGYYRFVYNGGHTAYVGVIAQEVQAVAPDAVVRGADGYLRVSYDRLGVPFETYDQWVRQGAKLPAVRLEEGR